MCKGTSLFRIRFLVIPLFAVALLGAAALCQEAGLNQAPEGFQALFNGKDLSNWRGQIDEDPREVARITKGMTPVQIQEKQKQADELTLRHWKVEDGVIHYDGTRRVGNLESRKHFGDFELYVDWKLPPGGDSGIFPRNMPQVQIWDPNRGARNVVGSGGLDNNFPQKERPHLDPIKKADKPIGQWNTFYIKMVGDKVWVKLNGETVIDGQPKGNYWTDFKEPPPERGPIVLQSHGTHLWFRNIFIRELKKNAPAAGRAAERPVAEWPAWRKAMTEPNTIYDISDNAITDIRYVWPGGEIPKGFATTDDGGRGTGATTTGYSGGVLLRGAGRWGAMPYGSGGHDTVANQLGCLNLNGDRAHFQVWQQPIYSLEPTPGAECYWSPKDAAALPEGRRFAYGKFDPSNWDKSFPLAIDRWVYTGPMKYDELADKVPTGQYRYAQHCYIPAEYTGLGTGVWFIPNSYKSAPGFRDDPAKEICDPTDVWPSGRKKWYAHYQREDTKAWGRVAEPVPEAVNGWLNPGATPGCAEFCAKHKRVVVPCGRNCDAAVFDLSKGIEQGTWSWKTCAKAGRWPDAWSGKCAVSNGHPRNRAFLVWLGIKENHTPSLNIMDLDDPKYTTHVVVLPSLKHPTVGECATLDYIPSLDRFLAFGLHGANYGTAKEKTIYCQKITIPDDLADTAAYAVEDVPLKLAPGVEFGRTAVGLYGKCQYHEDLNCVIFMVVDRPAKAFWVK